MLEWEEDWKYLFPGRVGINYPSINNTWENRGGSGDAPQEKPIQKSLRPKHTGTFAGAGPGALAHTGTGACSRARHVVGFGVLVPMTSGFKGLVRKRRGGGRRSRIYECMARGASIPFLYMPISANVKIALM